ncbi:MAG: DUF58 domain-containing protein [Anaeromicrobium sp.]|uniref:DUF58 domain-containing protein n=1 Tax=Anaeromicrobium sp. TaxID=1929132 RepID=UPI0025FE5D9C|nr:DUF58 domain-containing protein [Anaeromicrobium sp.]MCT4592889.1 DUF58 domain-containing protein [Anaeromicrobium sp.]
MEKFLREIENLKISPKKKLLKGGKGNYKGKGFGNSLDFHGHREYSLGDDIRKIDWKAYAKTEKFYIKEFTEERQMHVNVIVDNSASMNFGTPNKLEIGKMISLGISYLTLNQMDNLSFYTLNNKLNNIQRNIRGKEYFYRLTQDVSNIKFEEITDFSSIFNMDTFMSGMTFIISDFFGKEIEKILDFLCSKGQEVIAIHVLSSSEIDPDYGEELKLIDMETGSVRRIQFNPKIKKLYRDKMKSFIEECKNACNTRDVKYVLAPTDTSPTKILLKALGGF